MMTSNKPYFIRAIYDWIVDNELTPYLLVNANDAAVDVPQTYANEGKIVLNISPNACRQLKLENDLISFVARFGGKTVDISAPPSAVLRFMQKKMDGVWNLVRNTMNPRCRRHPQQDVRHIAKTHPNRC